MAYGNDNPTASAALEGSSGADESETQDNSKEESSENCFYLPGDFPGAENLKAGDTITLRVRGKDADGDIEVEHMDEGAMGDDGQKPIMQDFEESMK